MENKNTTHELPDWLREAGYTEEDMKPVDPNDPYGLDDRVTMPPAFVETKTFEERLKDEIYKAVMARLGSEDIRELHNYEYVYDYGDHNYAETEEQYDECVADLMAEATRYVLDWYVIHTEDESREAYAKEYEGEWIPCSERLPKEDGEYRTFVQFGLHEQPLHLQMNFSDGIWWHPFEEDTEVLAWMLADEPTEAHAGEGVL